MHSKFIILAFFLSSCWFQKDVKTWFYEAEKTTSAQIDCPGAKNIIILEKTDRQEVLEAAQRFLFIKNKRRSSENYTVLKLPDGRMTHIENVPPEFFYQCAVITLR